MLWVEMPVTSALLLDAHPEASEQDGGGSGLKHVRRDAFHHHMPPLGRQPPECHPFRGTVARADELTKTLWLRPGTANLPAQGRRRDTERLAQGHGGSRKSPIVVGRGGEGTQGGRGPRAGEGWRR